MKEVGLRLLLAVQGRPSDGSERQPTNASLTANDWRPRWHGD